MLILYDQKRTVSRNCKLSFMGYSSSDTIFWDTSSDEGRTVGNTSVSVAATAAMELSAGNCRVSAIAAQGIGTGIRLRGNAHQKLVVVATACIHGADLLAKDAIYVFRQHGMGPTPAKLTR